MTTRPEWAALISKAASDAHDAIAKLLKTHPDGHRLALDALLMAAASFAASHGETIEGRPTIEYAQQALCAFHMTMQRPASSTTPAARWINITRH